MEVKNREKANAYMRSYHKETPERAAKRKARDKAYYEKNRERILQREKEHRIQNKNTINERQRKSWLKHAYGMTFEDKYQMYNDQNGICFLCNRPLPSCEESVIEHNHKTDEVRGIAHHLCNLKLGQIEALFDKDLETLKRMLALLGL
jgi:site-specific DNA-cytosine methylase